MGSRLRGAVTNVTQNAEYDYHDRIGTATAQAMTIRHADTPFNPHTHTRRRNQVIGYNTADLFDNQDKLRMIINPTSGYARSQAMALGRQVDSSIIAAATGNAYSGKTGSTTVTWASVTATQTIAQNYVESGAAANSNLTIGKLRRARFLLDSVEAVMDGEQLNLIVTASQVQSLLRTTEVTSSDYNVVKALVNGEINTFMGFTFIRTELLSKSGDVRSCLAFPKSAILLGVAEETNVKIDPLPTKNYSVQVYSEATFGATRMWEEKVIELLCNETL